MSEWQPIETAPKDGSRFIGWLEDEKASVICAWFDPYGAEPNDFYIVDFDLGAEWHLLTHWMPLPEPLK